MFCLSHLIAAAATTCALALAAPAQAAIATEASVTLWAEPGSRVGATLPEGGVTWVHGVDGSFLTGDGDPFGATITYEGDEPWSFSFAAPLTDPVDGTFGPHRLQPQFYGDATRDPFSDWSRPGMEVAGGGRTDNVLYGAFDVLEIAFDRYNQLTRFAVDFVQYSGADTSGPALYGSLRFSANPAAPAPPSLPMAPPVPEPAMLAQWAVAALVLTGVMWRRRRSLP